MSLVSVHVCLQLSPSLQERAGLVCEKNLPCGHQCGGVKGEEDCLPCLHGCRPPQGADTSNWDKLKQDADDMCMICYTEGLSCAPSIQVRRHRQAGEGGLDRTTYTIRISLGHHH